MSDRLKSWVWQYGKRQGNKAFCDLCDDNSNKVFCCAGGSTGAFGRHLKLIHNINGNSQNQRYVFNFFIIILIKKQEME